MRLIDADALKEKSYRDEFAIDVVTVEDIDSAPTVEERPQGEWIKQGIYFTCPFCHCGCNSIITDRIIFGKLNYCPNCGADMRKGGAE